MFKERNIFNQWFQVRSIPLSCMPLINVYHNLASVGVRHSHGVQESDEEFDARYEAYFSRPDIDGWEVRKAMNDLQVYINNSPSSYTIGYI